MEEFYRSASSWSDGRGRETWGEQDWAESWGVGLGRGLGRDWLIMSVGGDDWKSERASGMLQFSL